jgi:mannitol/fructose-specific phosphotransferase system IIA component
MSILASDRIRLQARAAGKVDAIRQAGELLVHSGCVTPAYVDGMLAREAIMSTYLGNGIAIPHGQNENRADIRQTGISVLQVPGGVDWDEDEPVYLVIGIAASLDEHIGVLANLAEVIEDEETVAMLVQTDNPATILDSLGRPRHDS